MAQIREELTLIDKFSAQFTKFISMAEKASGAVQDVRGSLANIETAAASAALNMDRLAGEMQEFISRSGQSQAASSSLMGTLRQIGGVIGGMQAAKWLVNTSDQVTQIDARLRRMTGSAEAAAQAQEDIYAAAMRSRGSYLDMANLVSQLGTMAGDAFGDTGELISFAEQLNKQIALSGASPQAAQAAIYQLSQGLSSGVLRGEELNSVLEQTPAIAQTIAEYMGVSVGEMRELASEGAVTAEVVKNAMLDAASKTNTAFAETPLTWAQAWTMAQNMIIKALDPVLQAISWVINNLDTITPIVLGLAAAVGIYAAAMAISNAVTWLGVAANRALIASLLSNPILWIAVAIGIVIALIAKWVQSVGGLQVAWLICVNAVLTAWDWVKIGFFTGVYWVMDLWDKMKLSFQRVSVSIQNFMGDMKVGVLNILQSMVNGAISIINGFIGLLNKIPGVGIEAIEKVTFGADAALENEAAKQARNADLAAYEAEISRNIAGRAAALDQMKIDARAATAERELEILNKQNELAQQADTSGGAGSDEPVPVYSSDLSSIAADTSSIKKSVSLSEEDLSMLADMAERQYVNKINLTSQSPVITVQGANTGSTDLDRRNIADAIKRILLEQAASATTNSYASV